MSVTATGGVRNLRAIFENKSASDQSDRSPSRARYSSDSVASTSSRPVSIVRTSFIAVDSPAASSHIHQEHVRNNTGTSRMAESRKENHNVTSETSDAVPTSPHQTTHPIEGGLGTILKGSSFEGSPEQEVVGPRAAEINGGAAIVERIKSNEKPGPPPTVHLKTTPTAQPVKPPHPKHVPSNQAAATSKTATPPSAHKLPIRGGSAKVLGVLESSKEAREAREAARQDGSNKSPTAAGLHPAQESQQSTKAPSKRLPIRGGAAKIVGVMESAKQASEAREAFKQERTNKGAAPAESHPSTRTVSKRLPSAATTTAASRDGRKAGAAETTQKPAPNSRLSVPSRLPSAATAKTAASTAKTETEPSNNAPSPRARVASSARSPKVPSVATAVTASTLAKKASRGSLANGDQAKSRLSAAKPDESFLARMSRPTVSSASKSHDKAEAKSPPRSGKAKAITKTSPTAAVGHSEAGVSEPNHHVVDEPGATNGISV
ncbi:hypothetical protein DV738_g3969, partial [Chaetothyriales sp. CBS 135597]